MLYRTAATHFAQKATAKYAQRGRSSEPIALQITFQRRTFAGPVILTVQEIKLGARISTAHVTISQARDESVALFKTQNQAPDQIELKVKVLAYTTLAPPDAEEGPAVKGPWGGGDHLSSAATAGSLPGGSIDFEALAKNGTDGEWGAGPCAPPAIIVAKNLKIYSPSSTMLPKTVEERARQVFDQWAQFTPGGISARWSNEAVMWLADCLIAAFDRIGAMEEMRILATGSIARLN